MANFGWGQTAIQFTTMALAYKNNRRIRAINESLGKIEAGVIDIASRPDPYMDFIQEVNKISEQEAVQEFTRGYIAGAKDPATKLDLVLATIKLKDAVKGVE